jgi:hypothetical protein
MRIMAVMGRYGMKKLWNAISGLIFLAVCTVGFTNAAPWEGPAAVALGGELPDEGYYVATNSFPRNTVVDVTSLDTGKTIRVIVAAGLDSPGFLAILSRKAAAEVGLQGRSVARIRMSRPGDPMAYSRFLDGANPSTDPDYNPRAALNGAGQTNPVPSAEATPVQSSPAAPPNMEEYDLSMLPAENRPPAAPPYQGNLPPEAEIAPFNRPSYPPEETPAPPLDESMFIAPIERIPPIRSFDSPAPVQRVPSEGAYADITAPIETVPPIPPGSPGEDRRLSETAATDAPIERGSPVLPPSPERGAPGETIFSVPLINSLERNQYYLQLRALTQEEGVKQEISRIGKNYPLVVLRGEESGKIMYRILLGPVNQGESNALLQRFKTMGYNDAFLRQGS